MSNNIRIESPKFLGDAIRLPASKSTLGKDARAAARERIEKAQEMAKSDCLILTFEFGNTDKAVNNFVELLRGA